MGCTCDAVPPDGEDHNEPPPEHPTRGEYGGWSTGCILTPVGIGFFVLGMNAGLSPLVGSIFAAGSVPVVVGIAASRRRGEQSAGVRTARGLGWAYLVATALILLLLVVL